MAAMQHRVASLLPSATEMLCAIGGEDFLVGRSHEDNYPKSITNRPILTQSSLQHGLSSSEIDSTVSASVASGDELYMIVTEEVVRVRPTIVCTQNLCNVCSVSISDVDKALEGMNPAPQVLNFNPYALDDIFADMLRLGSALGMSLAAESAVFSLRERVRKVQNLCAKASVGKKRSIAFLEWADPVFVGGHWTPELVGLVGATHILNDAGHKSFRVPNKAVEDADPDMVILCPCGLSLNQALEEARSENCAWVRKLRGVREGSAICVDGDAMFNRPGPRLVDALEWLASWVYPDVPAIAALRPPNFPDAPWPAATPAKRVRDIEDYVEIHRQAVAQGKVTYDDPENGYTVFSEVYMLQRGWCCGSGCRHCPYGHFNVKGRPRKNRIVAPRLLGKGGKGAVGRGVLVAWTGPKTSLRDNRVIVCAVFSGEYETLSPDRTKVEDVMAWAQEHDVELLLAPEGQLVEALKLVQPTEWNLEEKSVAQEAWSLALSSKAA